MLIEKSKFEGCWRGRGCREPAYQDQGKAETIGSCGACNDNCNVSGSLPE